MIYVVPCFIIDAYTYSLTLMAPFYYMIWIEIAIISYLLVIFIFQSLMTVFIKYDLMMYEKVSKTGKKLLTDIPHLQVNKVKGN